MHRQEFKHNASFWIFPNKKCEFMLKSSPIEPGSCVRALLERRRSCRLSQPQICSSTISRLFFDTSRYTNCFSMPSIWIHTKIDNILNDIWLKPLDICQGLGSNVGYTESVDWNNPQTNITWVVMLRNFGWRTQEMILCKKVLHFWKLKTHFTCKGKPSEIIWRQWNGAHQPVEVCVQEWL